MIKIIGLSLLGVLALMLVPASLSDSSDNPYMGGMLTLVAYDAEGNEKYAQQVHNRIVNDGEDFIVDQVFSEGNTVADNAQVGKICAFQPNYFSYSQ